MKKKEEKNFYNTSGVTPVTIPFIKGPTGNPPSAPHPTGLSRDPPPAGLFRPPGPQGGPPPSMGGPGMGGPGMGGPGMGMGMGMPAGRGGFGPGPRHAPPFPHPPQGGGPHFGPPRGPPGGGPPPMAGGGRGGPLPPHHHHHQPPPPSAAAKPGAKPGPKPGGGDEEVIESEFVEIEDEFIERPRRPQKPPAAAVPAKAKPGGGAGRGDDSSDEYWPHRERTPLLPHKRRGRDGGDPERPRYHVIKFIYLFLFALSSLEVLIIMVTSGWLLHMLSCIAYDSCSPTGERLMSMGLYFGILTGVFVVPLLIGGLGIATSSPRILWFFSFVSALVDIIIVVLLSVYIRWEVALVMIPLILCALFGFAMSSLLSHEDALRGPDSRRNRCCLYLCC